MAYRIAKALDTLRSQVNAAWPNRSKISDGWIGDAAHSSRASDHNPWVKDGSMGVVTALDITHDPAHGVDGGQISETIKVDPRVKYVIYNRRIYNPSVLKAWRAYHGTNPHTKHVHVSVRPEKANYDSTLPWNLEGVIESSGGSPVVIPPAEPVRPLLKKGSKGEAVKDLQRLLGGLAVDGDFGPKTDAAVRAFQKANGLTVDGKVGPYTWGVLEKKTAQPNLAELPLHTSSKGIDHIKSFESLVLKAHQVGGIWHIGWGRSSTSGKPPKITSGMTITKAEADAMFLDDLADFENAVRTAVESALTQGQFDALVSIAFNKGATWFRNSALLKAVNAKDWSRAVLAILAEVPPVGHKFHNGLLRRRKAEAIMFKS